jgi:hypothetical protein
VSVETEENGGMRTQARALVWAAALTLVLGLAACGGGGDDDDAEASGDTPSESSTTEPDGTTTTAPPTPEEQAIAAYEASWDAEFVALNPPNPLHPGLTDVFTGEAAQTIAGIIVETQNAGQYYVGSMETHPTVASATAEEVLLNDCTIENSTTYDATTGAVVETGPYPPRSRQIEVVNQDGTWRVSVIRTLEDPCTPG